MDEQHQNRNNAGDRQSFLLDLHSLERAMLQCEKVYILTEVSTPEDEDPPEMDFEADGESSESDDWNIEEELERRKQHSVVHKNEGNEYFIKGDYDSAIRAYTIGIGLDQKNPILVANRAMAFLKTEDFEAAETDCTVCLSIDPTYVKAYYRRGVARSKLEKFYSAREDFSKALELEPNNELAQSKLYEIEQKINASEALIEKVDVHSQEFWSKALGNQNVEDPEDNNTLSDIIAASSSHDLECIFPDAKLLAPVQDSPNIDEKCFIEIPVSDLKERDFVNKVNLLKAAETKVNNEPCNSKLDNSVNLLKPTLPPIPNTAYQFFADWIRVSPYPSLKYQYLKQFPPADIKVIFKHFMEPELFPEILHTLSTQFLENGDDIVYFLKYLADIGRFNAMLMFLSSQEQKDLNILLDAVKSSNITNEEKEQLLSLYKI